MQTYLKSIDKPKSLDTLYSTYTKAKEYAVNSYLSDLSLVYSPSQIAIGCLRVASVETGFVEEFEGYLKKRLSGPAESFSQGGEDDDGEKVFGMLVGKIGEMEDVIKGAKGSVASKAECQEIDAMLKGCRNPECIVDSLMSVKRRSEEEEAGARKKAKKSISGTDDDAQVFL
jgi:cyclin H